MNRHLKALLAVSGIGALAIWGFNSFFLSKVQETPTSLVTLEQMQNRGVPNFSAKTFSGENLELNQFKGQVVILNFWASWCGPCVQEVPSLIKLAKSFHGDIKVLAISEDSNGEDIVAFLKSFPDLNQENIKIIYDQDHSKMKMFDILRLPESMILDKDLKLAKKITGSIDWYTKDSIEYLHTLIGK